MKSFDMELVGLWFEISTHRLSLSLYIERGGI